MFKTRATRTAATLGGMYLLAALATPGALEPPPRSQIGTAYLEGRLVDFRIEKARFARKRVLIGPWDFGARVGNPKPSDKRLNLYLVAPGDLHHADGAPEFDHNDIVNALPKVEDAVIEWDVYWAVVLDPELKEPIRGEQELLHAAQQWFAPGDQFAIDTVPGRTFLREFLKVTDILRLAKFRRKEDGALPRVIIVPAGFAVRASAKERVADVAQEPAAAPR